MYLPVILRRIFASKYCSHNNPHDSYVDFRNRDSFAGFQDGDWKDYVKFKSILIDFRNFYGLDKVVVKLKRKYGWKP